MVWLVVAETQVGDRIQSRMRRRRVAGEHITFTIVREVGKGQPARFMHNLLHFL
jgi:hypothetical protein